jgi:hypothetical protein
MPRAKKSDIATPATPATTEPQTISISEACQQLSTSEQSLRLALSHLRPDDFDTVKRLPTQDLHDLGKLINPPQLAAQSEPQSEPQTTTEPQTSEHEENLELAETSAQQDSQPATEKPQNHPIANLANRKGEQLTQSPIPNTQSDLLSEIDRIIGEELSLSSAVAEVRNRVILHNLAAADSELAEELNQRHQARKQAYLSSIRSMASNRKEITPLTPDAMDLDQELASVYSNLGK